VAKLSDNARYKQLLLDLAAPQPLPHYALDNFVPGANVAAYQSLVHLISQPEQGQTCMYLWGQASTGKTHLLQAASRAASERHITPAYIPLSQAKAFPPDVLDGLENMDLVCLDDIQHIVGLKDWENAVFRLFNQLRDAEIPLLVSANAPPKSLGLGLNDLVSRFSWGGVFFLEPLGESELRSVVQQYSVRLGLHLPLKTVNLLLRSVPSDLKMLIHCLEKIEHLSLVLKKKPNSSLVRHVLDDELKIAS
jgi:DnaA family protein